MSLYLASINSGSNGNCYYVGTSTEAILVDAGISCREIEKRMERLGLQASSVRALFITHEHSDHIRGVEVFSKKFKIPVYISKGTHQNSKLFIREDLLNYIENNSCIQIGGLEVRAFRKFHDAADPYSFVVSANEINVGVMTDIGHACQQVISAFRQCHAAVLEANYDEDMLMQGPYPFYLKKRISSEEGHLSNLQALELFKQHRHEHMSHLILGHLSRENNSPQLVQQLFSEQAGNTNIIVASRDYETELFQIHGSAQVRLIEKQNLEGCQISLFA
jgi:phosphoribosyl 1,2-cyclic phosphodiesterase